MDGDDVFGGPDASQDIMLKIKCIFKLLKSGWQGSGVKLIAVSWACWRSALTPGNRQTIQNFTAEYAKNVEEGYMLGKHYVIPGEA